MYSLIIDSTRHLIKIEDLRKHELEKLNEKIRHKNELYPCHGNYCNQVT